MIRSMTGFGRCRDTVNGRDITVEMKSVNSRYFDCSVKLSRSVGYLEERIKPYLQSKGVSRGKVDVWITVERTGVAASASGLNEDALQSYLRILYCLRDKYGLRDDISVMSVAANPELYTVTGQEENPEQDWADVCSVLDRAADAFLAVRGREGESLCRDIRQKLAFVAQATDQLERLSADCVLQYRERLAERVRTALADNRIVPDEARLLTECAIYADKISVDEELVRLRTHFDAMEQTLQSDGPVGRRLDFLLQEINREINTTGSKCGQAEMAQLVVSVKCELEKIREQIQNLE